MPAGSTAWAFDWKFLSEEFPEFVGSSFNDAFLVETPKSDFTINGSQITAPHNVAYDASHKLISVNTTGALGMSAPEAAGTTYDGGTAPLTTTVPLNGWHQPTHSQLFRDRPW